MVKKTVAFLVSLVVWLLVIFALLEIVKAPILKESRNSLKDKLAILIHNVSDLISPPRRRPLTTIELEENLKANLPVPFATFSEDDWQWFWHLLYGKFTQETKGWPKRKRQLSKEEIQNMLIDHYYQPFSYFNQQKWNIFWRDVLRGSVFKK